MALSSLLRLMIVLKRDDAQNISESATNQEVPVLFIGEEAWGNSNNNSLLSWIQQKSSVALNSNKNIFLCNIQFWSTQTYCTFNIGYANLAGQSKYIHCHVNIWDLRSVLPKLFWRADHKKIFTYSAKHKRLICISIDRLLVVRGANFGNHCLR